MSLVTIISIYREGGILKRLRATPLRPQTILTAHVLVKLALTALTMVLTVLAGKRYFPVHTHFPVFGFTIALLISTWSILSIGFLIASIVPTARFAQPIGAAILYPMIGLCGLFVPVHSMPPALQAVARVLPLTYAVSLLEGIAERRSRGRPISATSRRWLSYLRSARRFQRRCSAGNSAGFRRHSFGIGQTAPA